MITKETSLVFILFIFSRNTLKWFSQIHVTATNVTGGTFDLKLSKDKENWLNHKWPTMLPGWFETDEKQSAHGLVVGEESQVVNSMQTFSHC